MSKTYDIRRLTFLVVDDNSHMRTIMRTLLRGYGATQVYDAADAETAFVELRTQPIDIVILDYALGTLDGVEFTRLVRTAPDSPNPYVPIIMASAHSERKRITQARNAGVTEFLCKPICARDLYLRIVECIERPRPFIRTATFFGPDRRRRKSDAYKGPDRRVAEQHAL
ncbi:MAG: response regulator [Pseudomonadota bacterium]